MHYGSTVMPKVAAPAVTVTFNEDSVMLCALRWQQH